MIFPRGLDLKSADRVERQSGIELACTIDAPVNNGLKLEYKEYKESHSLRFGRSIMAMDGTKRQGRDGVMNSGDQEPCLQRALTITGELSGHLDTYLSVCYTKRKKVLGRGSIALYLFKSVGP